MTTHPGRDRLDVNKPGALIAALPAVLGFVPEKSLVLVAIEDGHLGAVMRVDLTDDLLDNVARLAEVVGNAGADAVAAIIVDADGALCPICDDGHRHLCAALRTALETQGIGLCAAHVVDRVEAGGSWRRVDACGVDGFGPAGRVDDPASSPLAAAAVLDGRRLYRRRADLMAVVAPADAERAARLADLIEVQTARRHDEWQDDPDGRARRDIGQARSAAARVGDGEELTDAEVADLACALSDVVVRDTLFGLAVGGEATRAETLWALLARTLPDPWRAEALGLLAFSAYARGDGPLAGVSLESALRSDPGHRMAGMLDTALQSGMRPEQIRELADTGYQVARRLGVELPRRLRPSGPSRRGPSRAAVRRSRGHRQRW